jgi:hypothetical protein
MMSNLSIDTNLQQHVAASPQVLWSGHIQQLEVKEP